MRPEYHIERRVKEDNVECILDAMGVQGYQLLSMCPTYLPDYSYQKPEFLLIFVKNKEQT